MSLYSSSSATHSTTNSMEQGHTICSSLVEISDGKGRPLPRRLILNSTHLYIQKNVGKETTDDADSTRPTHGSVSDRGLSGDGSFESFGDMDSPPPEYNKRELTLQRVEGSLGFSVRGGAEHSLPLIVSRIAPGSPAALSKQIFIGDAIIAINGAKITQMTHDDAMELLSSSGPTVNLRLKYFPTAKPFLSPTQQSLLESNLHQWEASDTDASANESWETERSIPLVFALLTRYLGGSDRLRYNAFEVRDATGNSSSGVIHCSDAYLLTSWVKCITDVILSLNNFQIKLWCQETQTEIYYVGWVWEGTSSDQDQTTVGGSGGSETSSNTSANNNMMDSRNDIWLTWRPKILAIRSDNLYYMEYPPGVGCDWEDGEKYPVICTLLRVLSSAGEHLDERQNCFTLQTATELEAFPTNGARQTPRTVYLSTETRQELIKVETAWTKAVTASVKAVKKYTFPVWWGGKPCQLELDYKGASFNMYRSSSKPTPPLWKKSFSSLKGSSDDSRTKLTLKFHGDDPPESMECRDLHRLLFALHSFLLAKVVH